MIIHIKDSTREYYFFKTIRNLIFLNNSNMYIM